MSFTGTAAQMAKRWEARTKALPRLLYGANKRIAIDMKFTAIVLSTGPASYAVLKQAGYPYARRNPQWTAFAGIINVHDGSVQGGWRVANNSYGGNLNTRLRLYNSSQWMTYLLRGTADMIRRPIDTDIVKLMRPISLKAYRQALISTLN